MRRAWQARALVEIDGRPKSKKIKLPPNHNIVVYMPRPERPPPEDAPEDDEAQDPAVVSGSESPSEASSELLASAADFLELNDYSGESTHAQIGDPGAEAQREGQGQAGTAGQSGETTDWRKRFQKQQIEAKENKVVEELLKRFETLAKAQPEIAKLLENLKVERSEQGVRIELVDNLEQPMFDLGSTTLAEAASPVLAEVARQVAGTESRLLITGHTDSRPYRGRRNYDNWDLSSERAHATRRALIAAGVAPSQIAGVLGRGDSDHANANDPFDPRNRRIGIMLLRDDDIPTATAAMEPSASGEAGPAPAPSQ